MEKLKKDVLLGVRSCLISTKGQLQLWQLDNDYKTIIGEGIPYQRLGFKKLEDYILSEPTLILKRINGDLCVDAKISEQSAHISEMVHQQKAQARKRRGPRRTAPFYSSKQAQLKTWQPKYVSPNKKQYIRSSRPAEVSHNQFVNRPSYNKPRVASKVVIPESSSFRNQSQSQQNKSQQSNSYHNPQKQDSKNKKTDISSRLQVNKPTANERSVSNGGLTVSVNNDIKNGFSTPGAKEDIDQTPCAPVSSSRLRITKKMSEINLDRDSGISSPTSENPFQLTSNIVVQATEVPQFVRTNDPIMDLNNFAEYYKLGMPETSTTQVKSGKKTLHIGLIKIDKQTFNSYPKEFDSPELAKRYCAEEALKVLTPEYFKRKSLLLASDKNILERIPSMIEKHNNGIWCRQLELDYADKYNEQLPSDWLKIIDSSPSIQVEKYQENYVLRHCKPGDKDQKWNMAMTLNDVSVPTNTVQFREDGKLCAIVTCVMSANEIWCRQGFTEESDRFNETMQRMEEYYTLYHERLKAESITADSYYVTKYDNTWFRIRAVSSSDTEVVCFFIDNGEEMVVPKETIYQLKREFAVSQAQAFVCRLVGLEDLYEASKNSEVLQSLLYRQVTLVSVPEIIPDDSEDVTVPVYMHDFETGDSINENIIPQLTFESASPVLQNKTLTEVYISNVEPNGDVYVQVLSEGFKHLQTLVHDLELEICKDPPTYLNSIVTKANSENKIYFAKYKVDGHWYRIQIVDWSQNDELAQIYFVDHGHTDIINVHEDILYPLDKLSDILNQYPFQAVKVRMAIEVIPVDFVALTKKAMPADLPVLLKILNFDNENVPWVEFYKRNIDGVLFCINKSIMIELEIKTGRGDSNNNFKSSKRNLAQFQEGLRGKNFPSGGTLQRPDLPEKGNYFKVHVPFAVNPYNFFVQPLETKVKLYEMMEKLQDRYKNVSYGTLKIDQIVPGNIYVSKFDDGNWYRTTVIKVIHSGSVSVFYCDFGYYGNLTVQKLNPIDAEFLQLPYQALKAKIAGIKPKQSNWTMADCDDFKMMVEKKDFYSIMLDIEKDELYESDVVLSLMLIDTSSTEDIYVGKELIKKGIAVGE